MNKDAILRSSLLDIIFDDRNKAYGAYILRRDYTNRMRLALAGMIVISVIFCLIAVTGSNNKKLIKNLSSVISPGIKISSYHNALPAVHKTVKVSARHAPDPLAPPVIVHSNNINKLPATTELIQQSIAGNSTATIDVPGGPGDESTAGKGLQENNVAPVAVKQEKPEIFYHADVMPQYPGGIKALLEFLKKNIHAPADADGENEVAVKVKFIVNYNGNLEGFDVVQSGGNAYDDEVLSVLKKMPQWIPGKINGENVSVYYIVPVTFARQD